MRSCMRLSITAALFFTTSLANSTDISLESMASLPPYSQMSLSEDGQKAVGLRAIKGRYQVVLLDFVTGEAKLLMAADPDLFEYNWCQFANATRIVCSYRTNGRKRAGTRTAGAIIGYPDGREVFTRLVAINTDRSNELQLIPPPVTEVNDHMVWNPSQQDNVVSWLPNEPEYILVQLKRDDFYHPSVFKLNIYTNRLSRVERYHPRIDAWHYDEKGELRLATGQYKGASTVHSFDKRVRKQVNVDHLQGARPLQFLGLAGRDNNAYFIGNLDNSDTRGVHLVDFKTGAVNQTVFQNPQFDTDSTWFHKPTGRLLFAGYRDAVDHVTWFDEGLERVFSSSLEAIGSPSSTKILSTSKDLKYALMSVQGNGVAQSTYRINLSNGDLLLLGTHQNQPDVDFSPIEYKAEDGTVISAYLALPGPRTEGPYPTVITPHSGPWPEAGIYSSFKGSDPWFVHRFLISQGYAILSPNFRGSSGFGDDLLTSGYRQWGELMQSDVMEGVEWMIQEGLADKNAVCMLGRHYGGYASLVASYKDPNSRIKCAVSISGVSDLRALKQRWRFYIRRDELLSKLQSGETMLPNSPRQNVSRIDAPILLFHGTADRAVPIEQSRELSRVLTKADKPFRFVEIPSADQHFSTEGERLQILQELEKFLSEHLSSSKNAPQAISHSDGQSPVSG